MENGSYQLSAIDMAALNGEAITELPEAMQRLAAKSSYLTAIRLMRELGGEKIYIPAPYTITAKHPVAQAIGLASAIELAHLYPTQSILIPSGSMAAKSARNREIFRLHRNGTGVKQLSEGFGLCQRSVIRIIQNEAERRATYAR